MRSMFDVYEMRNQLFWYSYFKKNIHYFCNDFLPFRKTIEKKIIKQKTLIRNLPMKTSHNFNDNPSSASNKNAQCDIFCSHPVPTHTQDKLQYNC